MLLFDSPAALAEEVGDEVFELAFDARATGSGLESSEAMTLP